MSPQLSLQQQFAWMQQGQQQPGQMRSKHTSSSDAASSSDAGAVDSEFSATSDGIAKWFCSSELMGAQQGLPPIPKHATMLKLEDIEH